MTGLTSRLRIAFVADTYDDGYGGAVVSARRFVEALRIRHEVTLLSTGRPGPGRVRLPALQFPVKAMRAMRFRFAVPRARVLRAIIEKADVVHLQYPFWVSFCALRVARACGVPVVAAFHVQPENLFYNVGWHAQWPVDSLYRFWIHRLYNQADQVICPSEFARSCLVDRGLQRPVEVISNGAFSIPPGQRGQGLDGEGQGMRQLLMVGRLAAEKRHDIVFEALRRSHHRDRIRLVVAGAGPMAGKLKRLARDLPAVEFSGYVGSQRLAQLYHESDLLVHASDVELEGMTVLEAMSHGLPVLVSDSPRSASSQFALTQQNLFRHGDADDLAKRIDALLDQPDGLRRQGEAHTMLAARYDFGDSVERLENLYRQLVT